MLTPSQSSIVAATLRSALTSAADLAGDTGDHFVDAAAALQDDRPGAREAHPVLPAIGATYAEELKVGPEDTAAAMGHPDPAVAVLGSPRIALWFEIVSSRLAPVTDPALTQVGAGILVHHLGRAEVGEVVSVSATVASVSGRRVVFSCAAQVADRSIALGTHQRVVVPRA